MLCVSAFLPAAWLRRSRPCSRVSAFNHLPYGVSVETYEENSGSSSIFWKIEISLIKLYFEMIVDSRADGGRVGRDIGRPLPWSLVAASCQGRGGVPGSPLTFVPSRHRRIHPHRRPSRRVATSPLFSPPRSSSAPGSH